MRIKVRGKEIFHHVLGLHLTLVGNIRFCLFLHSSRCKAAELCQHAAIKLRRWGRLKEPITGKEVN
jgi:hypothetical protein